MTRRITHNQYEADETLFQIVSEVNLKKLTAFVPYVTSSQSVMAFEYSSSFLPTISCTNSA